ncbi:hypothetical protein LAV84_25375 [Rhizobium sp. VS19-DR104.2]|uniref:hypothetical protein n=1 Tax=unclassified Rhizobium TaxID=2613769 RepID=UPI001C5B7E3E|nr:MULTISPECIES: hypothetical protein [unclassified Rhizobium]MBZ5762915.1 hypothetical protein [Rhizobium sp. VS19-DR96]MBZ5768720.1 hypothetical protein [Rhizobium sp. VS19-DR129.2]MBZ5776293.1 hypothetical protein [Rhizobium sp. VS19-DRK62.2]MBZ5787458.1 hypothetical protein [Rhizobium sp. VS19-DR121]MBZ5804856.1 hypothetical protein [Rhizobium sp. VS19-DR181]
MLFEKAVARSFSVVDRALRRSFPADYHKRCMYAAFGMQKLLSDFGHEASIQGGDAVAFMVSRSGQQAGMQGFANAPEGHAHYWVVAAGRLVDIGPHYLPQDSSFPAADVPLICWDLAGALPPFLRCRVFGDFGPLTALITTEEIHERMEAFIEQCRSKAKNLVGQPKLPTWLLTSLETVERSAAQSDVWAKGALRFASCLALRRA